MTLKQMTYILQGQKTRMQIMKSCEWLKEGILDEIKVWGYDTEQDAGTFCFVRYDKDENVWTGYYSLGIKSKWVSPFQVHQYIDKHFLSEVDMSGVTLYKQGEESQNTIIKGEEFICLNMKK